MAFLAYTGTGAIDDGSVTIAAIPITVPPIAGVFAGLNGSVVLSSSGSATFDGIGAIACGSISLASAGAASVPVYSGVASIACESVTISATATGGGPNVFGAGIVACGPLTILAMDSLTGVGLFVSGFVSITASGSFVAPSFAGASSDAFGEVTIEASGSTTTPGLDESTVSNLTAIISAGQIFLAWDSTAAAGSWFQVYINRKHVTSVMAARAIVPAPTSISTITVGSIAYSERQSDFSAFLPLVAGASSRVRLRWSGGRCLGDDIFGYRIYGSSVAGGAVDYSTPFAEIVAYPGGVVIDGAGIGGAGDGGAGRAASTYSWESARLASGVWTFAVVAVDEAGNEDALPPTKVCTIVAVPRPPAANSRGQRLTYTFNHTTRIPVLNWLASPG
jgi:hypothetical protein